MTRGEVRDEYFEWLFKVVCGGRFSKRITYDKLLRHLHDTPFRYSIHRDSSRAEDGIALRGRFARAIGYEREPELITDILIGPCSILEMMVALAIRCEETIMDDSEIGDRTGQWFWGMIASLGLGSMIDRRFDRGLVRDIVERFLDRDYEPDGRGGLFTIQDCDQDLRDVEIWYQLCWYLDSIA